MITHPPVVAAASRRRLPGPVQVVLIAWPCLAVLGALIGLALVRSGTWLFIGALSGSIAAFLLVAEYYGTRALLVLGKRILSAMAGSKQAPGTGLALGAARPASSGVWPGLAGTFVGLLVGGAGGALLGLLAVALWFGLAPAQPSGNEEGLQPFLAVLSGIVVGLPAGAVFGVLSGGVTGFVAGFRLARPKASPLPVT